MRHSRVKVIGDQRKREAGVLGHLRVLHQIVRGVFFARKRIAYFNHGIKISECLLEAIGQRPLWARAGGDVLSGVDYGWRDDF